MSRAEEAQALLRECEVVDLHVETFIPMRLVGYDVRRRHRPFLGGRFFGHLDLPRIDESGLGGAMWSITTNFLRSAAGRYRTLHENLRSLRQRLEETGRVAVVRTASEYRAARRAGRHAALLAVQGGNALDAWPVHLPPPRDLVRVTLVHLTPSKVGATSTPINLFRDRGLSAHGRALVERLDHHRIFVDLAHIHPRAFWDAVEVHDPSLPLLVTHTGVKGVRDHWRNIDDAQLRAVARTGGVVGIIFQAAFLRRRGGPRDLTMVLEHAEHVVRTIGEEHVAFGSDYDGAIVPPRDLRDGRAWPRLVEAMLARRWPASRIEKALGANALRCLESMRP